MHMKRVALVTSALALSAIVPTALGSHSTLNSPKCGGKMSVLVWPHGHPVIESVNFPAILNPHVEVYIGWSRKYPEALYAGYVVGGKPTGLIPVGDINVNSKCLNYGTPISAAATVPGGVTYTKEAGLLCTFSGAGVMDLIQQAGAKRVLILHRGKQVLLRADASPTKASVTVPKGSCKAESVPT